MCKRRRSSEVLLAFLQKFHRVTASCCQCCLWGVSALLKACESFKEKALFCCKISAARNENSGNDSGVFPFLISFRRQLVLAHAQERGLTPHAAGSILERVEARRFLPEKWQRSPTTPAPSVAATVAVAAARCGCVPRSNSKLRILTYISTHPQPAPAAGSLVLGSKPGNNAPKAYCQPR